jgi:hypothetical protein
MDIGEYVHLRSGQSNDDHRTENYMDLTLKILGDMWEDARLLVKC